jgi:hypothetical protein
MKDISRSNTYGLLLVHNSATMSLSSTTLMSINFLELLIKQLNYIIGMHAYNNYFTVSIISQVTTNCTHLPPCFYSIEVVVCVGSTGNPQLGQTESLVPLNRWFPQVEGCLGTIVVVIPRCRCYCMLIINGRFQKLAVTTTTLTDREGRLLYISVILGASTF